MNRIFYKDSIFVNVDNEKDASRFINDEFTEMTPEEIENAGMIGYENFVSSSNTKFENGQIVFTPPEPRSQEELVRQRIDEIKVAVQNVLDAKAQELEYDDGFALATYATSTKERYRNQANQFIAWRDNVWNKCYEILNAFQSGEIEMPTIEYVLERLPSLNWSDTSE